MTKSGNDYILSINPYVELPYRTNHELNHYADLLKSGTLDANDDNKLFKEMSKDLTKTVGDKYDQYFRLPTEQKAHMNQLREYMFDKGYISTRDEKVTPKLMQQVMNELDYYNIMHGNQRAAKQFKNISKYTKWFNTIPILGIGAATMYNNKEDK